jgi:signal transduction histidine kinase
MPHMKGAIDFRLLRGDVPGEGLEQLVRDLGGVLKYAVEWTGRGTDEGKDLIFTRTDQGPLGEERVRWLVQCKDYSQSAKSVGEADIGSVLEKVHQHRAAGYLLVTTTTVTSGLKKMLDSLDSRNGGPIRTHVWDNTELTKLLREKAESLLELHFIQSKVLIAELDDRELYRVSHAVGTFAVAINASLSRLEQKISAACPQIAHETRSRLVDCRSMVDALSFSIEKLTTPPHHFVADAVYKLTATFFKRIKDMSASIGRIHGRLDAEIVLPDTSQLEAIPPLKMSERSMSIVLLELLSNAITYSRTDPPIVVLRIAQQDERILLEVEGGMHIRPSDATNIFAPGYRTLEGMRVSANGFGMGLFLARSVLTECGGSLELVKGKEPTTFVISAPKASGSEK